MTAALGGDERLCKALIPTFPLGTRRITPAPGYLESLRAPNVEVVTEGIAQVVPEGIQLESGTIVAVDAIICATGFDNSFCPRFPVAGRYGNVQDRMRAETPKGYMSCALPGVPNYFSETCRFPRPLAAPLTEDSLLWTKRSDRPRQRLHAQRAHRSLLRARDPQVPDGCHQGHRPIRGRRGGLQPTHRRIHASDDVERPGPLVV